MTVLLPPDSAGRRFSLEPEVPSTKHLEAIFLNAVAYVAPTVLATLRDKPLSALRESAWSPGNVFLTPQIVAADIRLRQLRTTLSDWLAEWPLRDAWCCEWICATLGWWRMNPSWPTWFNPKPISQLTSVLPPPPTLDPTAPRSDYERAHRAYMESIERSASIHLLKTPEFRQPEHFYWLAGYHVCGWSPNLIAEAVGVWPFAAQYAINSLSSRLGLTQRPDRPMAPRDLERERQLEEIARLLNKVA